MALPLFDHGVTERPPQPAGRARHSDPETSHEAAARVDTTALEAAVLESLRREGPATTEQLQERMGGKSLVSISPRMKPLAMKGWIVQTGRAVNHSGRSAIVWAATRRD